MKKYSYDDIKKGNLFTLGHLRQFTGLSDRTLRNYLANGILKGEKINGIWHFSDKQIEDFVNSPTVRPSILAKNSGIVYDFIIDRNKPCDQSCIILDLPTADREQACEFFCYQINDGNFKDLQFSLDAPKNKQMRIILKGNVSDVLRLIGDYYKSSRL